MAEMKPLELGKAVHDIGLGELTPTEVAFRRDMLREQLQIGLQREGPPTIEDGGLLAIRTGIPPITAGVWDQVQSGAKAYIAEVGGTNWNVMKTKKQKNGSISITETSHASYPVGDRQLSFADFINRIAQPLADAVAAGNDLDQLIDVGIAVAFAHTNKKTDLGIDATFISVKDHGIMQKKWRITDWDHRKGGNMTKALRTRLQELGVNVRTLIAINDTPAVALDAVAISTASREGLDVVSAGFVGGTGTNGAVDNNGLINLEICMGKFPTDEVFQRMRRKGWVDIQEAELEIETGMYLPFRLAAGIQLLQEKYGWPTTNRQLLKELISNAPNKDQALVSKIASGEILSSPEIQQLAQQVMKRVGQVYGLTLATIAEGAEGANRSGKSKAFLVEGAALLKGYNTVAVAQKTAADLGQPLTIIEAKGLRGVATLAMVYPFLKK